ncbi:3-hydroxybutyryl-CoA dehydrogenase-like [Mangifera indica]|uniref:3-hydroxybutyryl-CoA dehydrogenase-like n=1 Tax=Mangifera indica TaxID=29780 RepID=UPI001CFBC7D0|nr:3-hydroxybutyryl-CoA dehydrogenase-like [Mangifera indica]
MGEIKAIGEVGGGQLGSGIAQLGAMHGLVVWLVDSDPDAVVRATKSISSSIQRFVSKGQLSQTAGTDALRLLSCTSNLEDLRSVSRAIVESEDVKKHLFLELDKITKPSASLASQVLYLLPK